ncbi:MAG TPA: TIR domain-containing protein [Bacteroidia bacterium]|nr:TIR domain-containing protein [Bacteroidia bacterium]
MKKGKVFKEKKEYIKQSDVPVIPLEAAVKVAQAINDNFAGSSAAPQEIALALNISPTSSKWQYLAGAAEAYGITDGASRANEISLTDLGRRIVAPIEENDDIIAMKEACLKPKILNDFFLKYNKQKLPKDDIAKNIMANMGVKREKTEQIFALIKENGKFVKIIRDTPTGLFVFLETLKSTQINGEKTEKTSADQLSTKDGMGMNEQQIIKDYEEKDIPVTSANALISKSKVFISHGKNKKIVDQLKEILTFGQFDVVISVEKESTAIPVPEKVFTDMRECDAGVIHVEGELELLDKEGNVHHTINQNVLIEIGAAIALYGKKFVLLCERSLKLPSNLQGLYRCDYDGKELSYDATMKLLKSFNEFRG